MSDDVSAPPPLVIMVLSANGEAWRLCESHAIYGRLIGMLEPPDRPTEMYRWLIEDGAHCEACQGQFSDLWARVVARYNREHTPPSTA